MKKFLLTTLAVTVSSSALSYAHDGGNLSHKGKYLRALVIREYGPHAAGRDIIRYGLRGGGEPSKRQKANYVRQLREFLITLPGYPALLGIVPRQPTKAPAGVMTASVQGTGYGGSSNAYVNPNCESGGNPQVRDPSGKYWGKYQFDYSTWVANGGSPPSYGNADVAEQDRVAANVTYDAWPNC
jgi:hypothetical protein